MPLLLSRGRGRGALLLLEDGREWWRRRDFPAIGRLAPGEALWKDGEGAGDWVVEEEEEKIHRMGSSGGASSGRRRQAGWQRQCGSEIWRR